MTTKQPLPKRTQRRSKNSRLTEFSSSVDSIVNEVSEQLKKLSPEK